MKKIKKGILILCCMTLIFFFSSESGVTSSKRSDGIIIQLSEWILRRPLTSQEKKNVIEVYTPIVRKGAHITMYFLLGLLWMSFWMEYSYPLRKQIYLSLMMVLLYAVFDEIHQSFIPERNGNIIDVGIDMIGGGLSFFCYSIVRRKKHE